MREWWPALFVFTLLFVLTVFVYRTAYPPQKQDAARPAPGEPLTPETQDAVARFWQNVERHQPVYEADELDCPVDGTKLKLKHRKSPDSDNRFGGVAGDLMSIALAPPAEGLGQPDFTRQDWIELPGTCSSCGAVFFEIDIINLNKGLAPGGPKALKDWKLAAQVPALAELPPEQWTKDEQLFVRFMALRQGKFPSFELGFYALPCAYASNFACWYGAPLEYRVPAAAYYALAAAEFKRELDSGTHVHDYEQATAAMLMGECYRLLGRSEDAAAGFERARKYSALDDVTLNVLTQLENWLEAGDYGLRRVEVEDARTPPVGWYIEQMLPAINANLDTHRAAWAALDDEQAIIDAINAALLAAPRPPGAAGQ